MSTIGQIFFYAGVVWLSAGAILALWIFIAIGCRWLDERHRETRMAAMIDDARAVQEIGMLEDLLSAPAYHGKGH